MPVHVGGRESLFKIDVYRLAGVKRGQLRTVSPLLHLEGNCRMFLRISVATGTRQNPRQKWSVDIGRRSHLSANMSQSSFQKPKQL